MNSTAEQLIAAGIALVGLLPAFVIWRRARKERLYAYQKMRMARATTQMEKLLLAGKFTHGQHCHDQIFRAMTYAQFLDSAPRFKIVKSTPEFEKLSAQIKEEISAAGREGDQCIREFSHALSLACLISHPWTFRYYKAEVMLGALSAWLKKRDRRKPVSTMIARTRSRHFGLTKTLVAQAALVTMVATVNQRSLQHCCDHSHAAGAAA